MGRLARWIWRRILDHLDRFRVANVCGEIVIRIPISYGKPMLGVEIDATWSDDGRESDRAGA